eukprot:TRINITY_DN7337_c0_g1_i1.p1 TRINITY_DN7337_c0_g1~~TRINITY_DN7337_c0_g1_i1.p1  ORF type:complete len:335 (-),score=62.30 TRINITY_DN7337_c0_g1_i1:137-1141(-)
MRKQCSFSSKQMLIKAILFAILAAVAVNVSAQPIRYHPLSEPRALPPYDHSMALRMLFFAGISSCDHKQILTWTCGGCGNVGNNVTVLAELENNPEDNFGFVAVDAFGPYGAEIVVSFRGSSNLKNWLEDLTFWLDKTIYQNLTDVRIHTGFYNGWKNMRAGVHAAVAKGLRMYPNARIVITGHSLGGALTEIFAVDLATTQVIGEPQDHLVGYPIPIYRDVFAYNFGAPRVGDDGWAELAQDTIYSYFRLTHAKDIVPLVPPQGLGFDYVHPPTEVWFKNEEPNDYVICSRINGEDPNCIDSVEVPSFKEDHGQYMGRDVSCTCPPLPPKKHL